jgi:hypothetical protein
MTNGPLGVRAEIAATGEVGLFLPLLGDYHTHVQLVDPGELSGSNLGFALDLGGSFSGAAGVARVAEQVSEHVSVAYAGAFLSAPGGYPSDRSWAPAGSVRFVASAEAAEHAVMEQLREGASVIKVSLNSDAGPALTLATLEAICTVAHRQRVTVVGHAEGAGMTELALNGGVDVLAHAPFTEVVKRDVLEQCVARGMTWITTFDIHGFGSPSPEQAENLSLALDNSWRFVEAGGALLYGTDLGNGSVPVRLNSREIELMHEVGLDAQGILTAMSSTWLTRHTGARIDSARGAFVPVDEDMSGSLDDMLSALTRTRPIHSTELVSYDD